MEIYFDYDTTTVYDGLNRITGYSQRSGEEFKPCAINQPPTPTMEKSLFNGDGVPRFILNLDGSITDSPLTENEKIKLDKVKKVRFEKDYPIETQLEILMLGIENKNDPVYREFDRRKKEIKTLKELK